MIEVIQVSTRNNRGHKDNHHFGFLLIDGFSHYAFAAALEPLRSANILLEQDRFTWSLIGTDKSTIHASNGLGCVVDMTCDEAFEMSNVIVCAGNNAAKLSTKPVEAWLRRCFRHGTKIGAVSSGVVVLAKAGLLDGISCAAHWEDIPHIRETYPFVEITDHIYQIHERIFTSAGGAASSHMMLKLIEELGGNTLAIDVATRMIIPRIRDGQDTANAPPHVRYGTWNKLVLAAIEIMNENIEEPISVITIASRLHVSIRQLERQFKAILRTTPNKFYLRIRLSQARQLVLYSDISIFDVALMCGFGNQQVMKKNYERLYGQSPIEERREKSRVRVPVVKVLHKLASDY